MEELSHWNLGAKLKSFGVISGICGNDLNATVMVDTTSENWLMEANAAKFDEAWQPRSRSMMVTP